MNSVLLQICLAFIMDCPFHCGLESVTRETVRDQKQYFSFIATSLLLSLMKIKMHMPTCPNAGAACPFAQFGCLYAGEANTIRNHLSEEPIRHLSLLCDGVLDLKCITLEKLYGSQMIWRIDNVKQKQNEARSGARTTIFSNPFMSGRHGYKMVLSASLYGDGTMRGQYLSVFVGIMKGEYDALLKWPFTHRVTLTLMDQNPNTESRNNIIYVIEPTPVAAHKPFLDRPISERNASFGAVKFCELDIAERYIISLIQTAEYQSEVLQLVSIPCQNSTKK
uniref:MATH domain-containing protein n=1 Tax=Syphacia muris TaxID=451379 RepID=A0A0N5A8G2_9BILA